MNLLTIELNNLWFDELRIGSKNTSPFDTIWFFRFLFQMFFFSVDEIYVLCVWFNDQTLDVCVLQFKWRIPLQRKISNYKSLEWILFDDKARKFETILQKVFDFKWKAFFVVSLNFQPWWSTVFSTDLDFLFFSFFSLFFLK